MLYIPYDDVIPFRDYVINFLQGKSIDVNAEELRNFYDFKSIVNWLNINAKKHNKQILSMYKFEGKQVGILYHFTNFKNLKEILISNKMISYPYISFTRNPNLLFYEKSRGFNGGIENMYLPIRIVIDGDKLSNNYKIEPYNHFNIKEIGNENGQYDYNKYSLPNYNENEERVKGDITNIRDYIIKVDINSKSKKDSKMALEIKKILEKNNIPYSFIKFSNMYKKSISEENKKEYKELSQRLNNLTQQYSDSGDNETLKQINELKDRMDNLYKDKLDKKSDYNKGYDETDENEIEKKLDYPYYKFMYIKRIKYDEKNNSLLASTNKEDFYDDKEYFYNSDLIKYDNFLNNRIKYYKMFGEENVKKAVENPNQWITLIDKLDKKSINEEHLKEDHDRFEKIDDKADEIKGEIDELEKDDKTLEKKSFHYKGYDIETEQPGGNLVIYIYKGVDLITEIDNLEAKENGIKQAKEFVDSELSKSAKLKKKSNYSAKIEELKELKQMFEHDMYTEMGEDNPNQENIDYYIQQIEKLKAEIFQLEEEKFNYEKQSLKKKADSYSTGNARVISKGFDFYDLISDQKFKEIVRTTPDEMQRYDKCKERVQEMLMDEGEDDFSISDIYDRELSEDGNQIQQAIEHLKEDEEDEKMEYTSLKKKSMKDAHGKPIELNRRVRFTWEGKDYEGYVTTNTDDAEKNQFVWVDADNGESYCIENSEDILCLYGSDNKPLYQDNEMIEENEPSEDYGKYEITNEYGKSAILEVKKINGNWKENLLNSDEDFYYNPVKYMSYLSIYDIEDWLRKDFERVRKLSSLKKKYSNLLGEEELIEVEPELDNSLNFDEEIISEPELEQETIDPNQAKEVISDQLKELFLKNYKNHYTYDNIYKCVTEAGLSELDRYDLINYMNDLAVTVKLPRIGWDNYFPEEELDYKGFADHNNHITFNEDDTPNMEEISEQFDNEPVDLYEIDRILEERIKHFTELNPVIDESVDIVRRSLKNLKRKNATVIKYKLNNIIVKKADNSGKVVEGEIKYQIRLQGKENKKNIKEIEISLPIRSKKVELPKQFFYNQKNYPLENYYINDIMEK